MPDHLDVTEDKAGRSERLDPHRQLCAVSAVSARMALDVCDRLTGDAQRRVDGRAWPAHLLGVVGTVDVAVAGMGRKLRGRNDLVETGATIVAQVVESDVTAPAPPLRLLWRSVVALQPETLGLSKPDVQRRLPRCGSVQLIAD